MKKKRSRSNILSNTFQGLAELVGTFGTWIIIAIVFFGDLYFFYLGFKLGSTIMVALSFFAFPFVGPLGAYCFFFGVPVWMTNIIG
tara:strand:- start:1329 stop:1586 length:258 start_codon:yes stop_codon:yes gene_type:complete